MDELLHSWTGNEALDVLQRDAFLYFLKEANPANGLVMDNTRADEPPWAGNAPASIAAVGFTLAAYPVGVERGLLTRAEAVGRTLVTLRFFRTSPQGTKPDAAGYQGFYYHFLDMQSGRRVGQCELSTVDPLARLIDSGVLRPVVGKVFRLADARQAYQFKPERGKVVRQVIDNE